jgi:hypothetical protein
MSFVQTVVAVASFLLSKPDLKKSGHFERSYFSQDTLQSPPLPHPLNLRQRMTGWKDLYHCFVDVHSIY